MMLLLALFIEYFKIGLFAIGGGMATIPFLTKLADKTHWFTQMDLLNMIAVSESTPGPIGVNTATYVGFHIDGLTGMLSATIGLVTPSVIVVIAIYSVLKKFGQNHYVKSGMYGLRAASCGLIAAAGLLVAKVTLIDAAVWKETGTSSRLSLGAVSYWQLYCSSLRRSSKRSTLWSGLLQLPWLASYFILEGRKIKSSPVSTERVRQGS